MLKKIFLLSLLVVLVFAVSCFAEAKIKLGVSAGPHEEIAEVVKGIASADGLEVEVVVFSDFVLPNAALIDGAIDVNSFQHLPYLENMVKDRGYKIKTIGNTVIMPMAAYSNKVKSIGEIQDNMSMAIPNDPSNGGRALLLLAAQNLIKLDPEAGIVPTIADILDNPKNFKFIELDAAQLVRARDDADIVVITSNYAIESGLVPQRDSLFVEGSDSPYVNIIAVRDGEESRPEFKILLKAYNSDETKKFVTERFKGSLLCGW